MPERHVWRLSRCCLAAFLALALNGLVHSAVPAGQVLERHTVAVDGHPFAVWSKTPPAPRSVMLLVHGRTWSTRPDFDLQAGKESLSLMDGFTAMGVAVYGVDLRGYGETPRDASGWLTPDRAARDVAAVLSWLTNRHPDLSPPVLFGWSYGAMVSQLVAQRYSDAIAGLILFGYPVRPGIDNNPEGAKPARAPTTAAAAASDFLLPGTISQAAIDAFVQSALSHDPVRADWRALEQWRGLNAAEVVTPTLLLQAEHDPLALADVHAEFFAALATADKAWAVIPGGDHAAFMETPRPYFLALIESFVFRGASAAPE